MTSRFSTSLLLSRINKYSCPRIFQPSVLSFQITQTNINADPFRVVFLWLANLWLNTFSHLGVSSRFCSAYRTVGTGPEQLGKNHGRKGLTESDGLLFKYALVYKIGILHIYSKDRDLHTYIHMLYIHLFTVQNTLLRSL